MTPDEIKSAITGWCSHGTGVQLVEDRSEPGADFVLGLRAAVAGSAGTVPVEARLDQLGERVTLTSTSTGGAGSDKVRTLLEQRPAAVRTEAGGGGTLVRADVYMDGLSRHAFVTAVEEVAKTRSLVDALTGATSGAAAGSQAYTPASTTAQPDPWSPEGSGAAAQPTPAYSQPSSTLPQPSFGGAAAQSSGYSPLSGQPAQQSQPSGAGFSPTHTVPPQGMQAWVAPDPNGSVVATLGGGLPIQVTEVRGAWAHVLCSNGWTGWVDGRIIGVAH